MEKTKYGNTSCQLADFSSVFLISLFFGENSFRENSVFLISLFFGENSFRERNRQMFTVAGEY